MTLFSPLKTLSLQNQLRLMTGLSLLGMLAVIVFVMLNLSRLREEFRSFKSLQRAGATMSDADAQKTLQEMADNWATYSKGYRGAMKIAETSPQDALVIPDAIYDMYMIPMVQQIDTLVRANKSLEAASAQNIDSGMNDLLWLVLAPMVMLGLLTLVSQTLFGQHLRKRLDAIISEITHLHNGDLSRRLPVYNQDEISHLADTINNYIARFQTILHKVHTSADQTQRTAHGVSAMARSVTANAKEQSAKASQVSEAIEGMGNTIKTIASNASNAAARPARRWTWCVTAAIPAAPPSSR